MPLRHILTPIQIGRVEIPNRVVRTAHGTDIGNFHVDENLIAYHAARAKGGVGLSILETLSAHPQSSPGHLDKRDPDLIPGYRRLMKAVDPYGMRVLQQIWHGGHNAHTHDGSPPWSSSDRPGVWDGIGAIPMTQSMIDTVVEGFADIAGIVEEGGLTGVEVHGAHGYLLQQFLSPLHNKRTDDYGGSLENRMRLILEVMRAVRGRVSRDFIVGIRLSPEMMKGGTTVEDCIAVLERLQDEDLIDYVSLSMGNYYMMHKIIGAMHEPVGYELPQSSIIGANAKVPRIVSGRFRTLEEADQVISRGEADLVGMTRAHIADPDIVRKTREGRPDEVRPCIACNQGCLGGKAEIGHLGCTINVAVGEELTLAEDLIQRAETPLRVLVVGGGPAGLEAARVAALGGHSVVLAEAGPDLGGAMVVARLCPRRQTIGDVIDWLTSEVYRLGVEVRLSTYMDADDIAAEGADKVILATGSLPRLDGFQLYAPDDVPSGLNQPHVVTSWDVLTRAVRIPEGGDAVVFDSIGHYEAIGVAEYLIDQGCRVTFVTGHHAIAPKMEVSFTIDPALERLAKTGRFRLLTRSRLVAIQPDKVEVAPIYAPQQVEEIAAGLVVLVTQNQSNRELHEELQSRGITAPLVGDALSPRFLRIAIREGHLAARGL
ncbi:FAD-dependent oxidoreductase [Sphingobium sp.]|uniref:oxidoreductase n=1 Tax=Sphingobium sp. TaxID=1912891 RepID=UPI0028BD5D8F|nr:FAD-dependent oxidoreductase [Sphingobium sp.]